MRSVAGTLQFSPKREFTRKLRPRGTGESVLGLGVRTRIAAQAGLAAGSLILFAPSAIAACSSLDPTPTVTSTGDPFIMGDQAYIVAPSTGLYFQDSIPGGASSAVITSGVLVDSRGTSNSGIEITGQFDVCYDGLASGAIVSDDTGMFILLTDGDIILNIAHGIEADFVGIEVAHQGDGLIDIDAGVIDSGDAGILVERNIGEGTTDITANGAITAVGPGVVVLNSPLTNGDVNVTTKADITSDDSGVAIVHYGDAGSVSIATAAGTTIRSYGGTGPGIYGPTGLYVERQGASAGPTPDLVRIDNDADVDAEGVGIGVKLCDSANSAHEI